MRTDSKQHGRDYATYLRLLPVSIIADAKARMTQHCERQAAKFSEAFKAGRCSICGSELTSFVRSQPCLHWLLRPEGFEKSDFERITDRFSLEEIEQYIRRVANEGVPAKNINDMREEGKKKGDLIELTTKYGDFEWSISCARGDYDGHESDSAASRKPHYHFQMRIGAKRYIDYADFHIPLHHSDLVTMEAMQKAPDLVARNFAGGAGMADFFAPERFEKLAMDGAIAENEDDGLANMAFIVRARARESIRAEDALAAAREAHEKRRAPGRQLSELGDVEVIAEPGRNVVRQALRRGGRGRRR